MTTEQLNQARAERWRQAGNPLLTADDASAWLRETGLCLFLPSAQQLATAAPSFVEAVLGASNRTPALDAIETATQMLHRLLATREAIALHLLGGPGEQPDLLATPETLPFIFALLGDKEWKRGPRGKSSPLVIEVWKLLDREGPLTTIEVKDKLGRQLTETAALRALSDLWSHLRIEPVFRAGQPAAWQLLERNHLKPMQAGSTISQAVALSALVSLYLQSAVAASGEEVERFLSPLASRTKIREVLKGLTATRQLSTLNMGPVELYHVEGSLPGFAEAAGVEGVVVEGVVVEAASPAAEGAIGEGRKRFVARRLAAETTESAPGERTRRPAGGRDSKTAPSRTLDRPSGDRPAAGGGERKPSDRSGSADRRPFAPRPGTGSGERRPYGTRPPAGSSFNPREPWKEDRKPAAPRGEGAERRPFAERSGEGAAPRRPFAPRDGERKSFPPRSDQGERKSFAPRTGDRSFQSRADAKPFGERKNFAARTDGDRKAFSPRSDGGERKSFAPRGDGERKPFPPRHRKPFAPSTEGDRKTFPTREGERTSFVPRSGDRPFKPRFDAKPGAKPFGERKSFAPRGESSRKPFAPRSSAGDRKPFPTRDGERKPFVPRSGDRPFKPRSDVRPGARPFGDRKSFTPRDGGSGARKPFTPRSEGKPFSPRTGDRPFKPRSSARPEFPGNAERPAGARPSSATARPGGPGARKATGFRKPAGAGKTAGAIRARTSPFTSSGKPRTGFTPPVGRPGARATRPAGRPSTPGARPPRPGARGGFKRVGRPGKGRSK